MSWEPNLCSLAAVGKQSFLPTPAVSPQNSADLFQACLFWQIKWLYPLTFWWKNTRDRYFLLQFLLKKLSLRYFDNKLQLTYSLLFMFIVSWLEQAHFPLIKQNAFLCCNPLHYHFHLHNILQGKQRHTASNIFPRQKSQSTDK